MNLEKKILVTGAQPTGGFHLGNYLGAVKNWCALQNEFECYFFIPNQHAITCPPYSPAELRRNTLQMVAQYVACGLDPERAHIFTQSSVTGHTELAWILACLTSTGQLFRMTQFKAKSQEKEFVGSGLLYYPILMAADILLYNAHLVPVGEDQKQHVELTRDLAQKFNQTYSETFNLPEPYILTTGARVYSLQNPLKKMSKSDPNEKGTIFIFESLDRIRKKFQSAVTDSKNGVYFSKDKPGISNLLDILSALTGDSLQVLEDRYGGYTYDRFKSLVADILIEHLTPLQERYTYLLEHKDYLEKILETGQEFAQKQASKMLAKVYRKVGFI